MNLFKLMSHPMIYCEFNLHMFHLWNGESGWSIPLERQDDGKLTQACFQNVSARLKSVFKTNSESPRFRVFCAINGRGVSLRKLKIPPAHGNETESLLKMQIESDFPLSPEDLAWGYEPIPQVNGATSDAGNEYCVAAVKKEIVEQYAELLRGAGCEPEFTLSTLARRSLCQHTDPSCAILDIGSLQSELTLFENGVPVLLRILPWGSDHLVQKLCARLRISTAEARSIISPIDESWKGTSPKAKDVTPVIKEEMEGLSELLMRTTNAMKWYVCSDLIKSQMLVESLTTAMQDGAICQALTLPYGKGYSAAVCGLMKNETSLLLAIHSTIAAPVASKPELWRWVALAVCLGIGAFFMRYLEPLLYKPALIAKLRDIQEQRKKLPEIDRELNFLQHLKTNQPPYLETMAQIANAAPQGTLIDTLSMNRRGELSLRGTFQQPPQAIQFRSTLVSNGFFSTVVAADLSPSPDRQKWIVRINAQWNPTKNYGPVKGATNETPAMPDKEHRGITQPGQPPSEDAATRLSAQTK